MNYHVGSYGARVCVAVVVLFWSRDTLYDSMFDVSRVACRGFLRFFFLILGALSGGDGSGAGGGSMSGVIYSDDDSDLSVSDIDQRVIASECFLRRFSCCGAFTEHRDQFISG